MYSYDDVDYILCYVYYEDWGDCVSFLVFGVDMDCFIELVVVIVDYVKVV